MEAQHILSEITDFWYLDFDIDLRQRRCCSEKKNIPDVSFDPNFCVLGFPGLCG
jgi:hypothetical protein